jgi:ketopantoate reductase
MNVLIVGAGVIGATYAWQMSLVGDEVTILVRPGKREQYEQNRIRIRCADERKRPVEKIETMFRPRVVEEFSPADGHDLVLVCVKSHQLDPLLPRLAAGAGRADILFFQNNWRGDEKIRDCLPNGQYLFGFSRLVGGWRTENTIECVIFNAPGMSTMLGEKDGESTPRLKTIADSIRRAGLKPEISRQILGWLATHYVEYLGAVAAILKAGSTQAFAQDGGLVREAILATRGGLAVCRAHGIDIGKAAPFNLRLYALPLALLVPLAKAQYQAPNIQEFFQENITHGMDELAVQYYSVLEEGHQRGVAMPCLEAFEPYYRPYHP